MFIDNWEMMLFTMVVNTEGVTKGVSAYQWLQFRSLHNCFLAKYGLRSKLILHAAGTLYLVYWYIPSVPKHIGANVLT